MPKITCGILCYNEVNLIEPCILSLVDWADNIIISDGTMCGTIDNKLFGFKCEPSTDGTLEIVKNLAKKHSNIAEFHFHGSPKMEEKDIRNLQKSLSSDDWFMIVDCDEIWAKPQLLKLKEFLKENKNNDVIAQNLNFFYDANTYLTQNHKRIFRNFPGRIFYGNNEMADENYIVAPSDILYYHYAYVDKEKVKTRCNLYNTDYYAHCGPWWFENIYMKYDGTNFDELIAKNGGTFHLFGKRHPGYAKDSWILKTDVSMKHPIVMKPYLEGLGLNASYF